MAFLAGKQIGNQSIDLGKLSGSGNVNFLTGSNITFNAGAIARVTDIPTNSLDIVNKAYVDSIASGLIPLEAAAVASTANIAGTFTIASPAGPGDLLTTTSANLTIDGVDLVNGMRILIHHQTVETQNGIYVVSGVGAAIVFTRAEDLNGSPTTELTLGKYVLVTGGTTHGNTGFVLIASGTPGETNPLTIDVDPIIFTAITAAGTMTASGGVTRTGNNLTWTPSDVTTATSASGDFIFFGDITNSDLPGKETISNFISTHGIISDAAITGTAGYVVKTGSGYTAVNFAVYNNTSAFAGLKVINTDGVAGNTTFGIDLDILTAGAGIDNADLLLIHDVSSSKNVKYTWGTLFGGVVNAVTANDGTDTINTSAHGLDFIGGNGITIATTANAGQISIGANLTANGGIVAGVGGDLYVNLGATSITGINVVTHGGTGISAISAGQLLYGSGVNTIAALAIGADGQKLQLVNGLPEWVDSSGDISSVVAGPGLTGGGTSGDVTLTIGAGNGITVDADSITIKEDITTTAGNIANSINVSANGVAIKVDNITIDGIGGIGGNQLQVKDGGIKIAQLDVTAPTADGYILTSSGTGFVWVASTAVGGEHVDLLFRTGNTQFADSGTSTTDGSIVVSNVFLDGTGTANYVPNTRTTINAYVNGLKIMIAQNSAAQLYASGWFALPGATQVAVAFDALDGTENFVWNTDTIAGYGIATATDVITFSFSI